MYMQTAELERFKIIGAPPIKTPEVYEKFLPYAMALGIEEQWNHQFASVFKQYEHDHGSTCSPIWFIGGPFNMFGSSFGSSFSDSFASAISQSTISASSSAPGSGSGFSSGSGSSGGGGGGGGGGGW
jgi:uncharacterized membrane protein